MIGRGGMSRVWLIEREEDHTIWAMKEIDKTTKEFKASCNADGSLTEVEIIRAISHPTTPEVIDIFEDDTSIQVFMEYINGKSLKNYLDEHGPLDPNTAVRYILEICELFIYLHTRPVPIIYRDLKASNIMMHQDDTIRLIDFGIAVYKDKKKTYRPLGTKGYASPEHYKGIVDERSDIYTIGKCLFNLLTGVNPSKIKVEEYMNDHPDSIPKVLGEIIAKATKTDPKERYQTVSTMHNDLAAYILPKKKGIKSFLSTYFT